MKAIIVIALFFWILEPKSHAQTTASTSLSEAEVAHIVKTANDTEINIAKLAKRKANNTHVKGYADLMEAAHRVNNEEHKAVMRDAQIKPENNSVSKILRKDSFNKTRVSRLT